MNLSSNDCSLVAYPIGVMAITRSFSEILINDSTTFLRKNPATQQLAKFIVALAERKLLARFSIKVVHKSCVLFNQEQGSAHEKQKHQHSQQCQAHGKQEIVFR